MESSEDVRGRMAALACGLATFALAGCVTVAPRQETAGAAGAEAAPVDEPPPAAPFPVMLGIDVMETQGFALLAGKRVALLTHDAAANRAGEPTWSVLHRSPGFDLLALLAAEHGLEGKAPASAVIHDHTHGTTGLPVHSLYGTTRRPTVRLLKQFDVLVVDLQDIGSRSYTFVSAMREALEACFKAGVEVVVLDRPNPLGGVKVDGPMVDPEWRSYVGAFPVPYVHGLTMGELARFALAHPEVLDLNEEARAAARLTVVPMRGWKRSMRWPDTGLPWRPTSPFIQDFAAVEGYPMTGLGCLVGGWTHGVGRNDPFRGLAFRGKTADQIVAELGTLGIPGLAFRKVEVAGNDGKPRHGTVIEITDWEVLRPTELNFHLNRLACFWSEANPFRSATREQRQVVNRHVGSTEWWEAIVRDGAKVDVAAFVARWEEEARAFREGSRALWLYPDEREQ